MTEKPSNQGKPSPYKSRALDATRRVSASCPDAETLQNVLSGNVTEDIASHLDVCELCRSRLGSLSDSEHLNEYRAVARDLGDFTRDLDPPDRVGDLGSIAGLRVIEVVGQGGMGVVFRGLDETLGREVAIKLLPRQSSQDSITRFEREARAAAKLSHDHVVSVFQAGRTESGQSYLVMPLIAGQSLKEKLEQRQENTGLKPRTAAAIAMQIASGLEAAHQAGLIHRDVKPGNIMLDREDGRAKLTDFGLVRNQTDETLTQGNLICGTPAYMSPEQIENPDTQDARGDIYSLGVVLYQCLTGSTPYRGMPMEILDQHRTAVPVPPRKMNSAIPEDLQNICLKAMARRPADRYQSATEFADDLQRFIDGRPVLARELSRFSLLVNWCQRNPVLSAWVGISIALLCVIAIGSTAAALRLKNANETILSEKSRAESAEQAAIQDRAAALTTLESLVDSLYDDLSESPGTIRTRDKVVNAAMKGLETLSNQPGDQRSEQTRLRALLRMGDLASLQKKLKQAESKYKDAIDLAKQQVESNPDSLERLKLHSFALVKLATHFWSTMDPRLNEINNQAESTLEKILEIEPGDIEATLQLFETQNMKLEAIRMKSPEDAAQLVELGDRYLDDLKQFREAAPGVDTHWVAQRLNFIVGRAHLESNSAEKASRHFLKSEQELSQLLNQSPENIQYQAAAASLFRAQGMAIGAGGDLAKATPYLRKAVQSFDRLAAADPNNLQTKLQAINSRLILSMAEEFAGDFDKATLMLRENLKALNEMLDDAPGEVGILIQVVFTQNRLLDLDLKNEKPESFIARSKELEKQFESFSDEIQAAITPNLKSQIPLFSSVASLLSGETKKDIHPLAKTTAIDWLLLWDAKKNHSLRISDPTLEKIRRIQQPFDATSYHDAFEHLGSSVPKQLPSQVRQLMHEANTFAVLAENLADSPSSKEDFETAKQRCIDRLRRLGQIAPIYQLKDGVLNDPFLIWMRQQPEFKTYWNELQAGEK